MSAARIFTILTLLSLFILSFGNDHPALIHLSIPPNAKATAMGHAYAASVGDPSIVYYNPGALAFHDRSGFTFMNQGFPPGMARLIEKGMLAFTGKVLYQDEVIPPEPAWLFLIEGMRSVGGAAVFPHGVIGTFGASLSYFTSGIRDVYNYEGQYLGSFELYDYAIGASYSRIIFRRLGVGINVKYIGSTRLTELSFYEPPEVDGGKTIALDAGVLSRIYGIGLGASITNLGPRIKYANDTSYTGYRLPTRYRWGISLEPVVFLDSVLSIAKYKVMNIPVTDILNIKFCYDRSYDPEETSGSGRLWECSGWEFTFLKYFSYRFGSFQIWDETSGVGLKLPNIEFDVARYYSNSYHVQISLYSHPPPEHIKNNQKLHNILKITTAALAPGGAQFYKGEGLKGSAFLAPALLLANSYYSTDNNRTKTLSLIGIAALYVGAAMEALLTD
ncbi:MAG: hypothetical protein JSV53_09325 [candidate division WOR-3 bacterium]|nr:MAG: hypothetical protein JSV53_09325 [candidate division WOR-3 bacterium]